MVSLKFRIQNLLLKALFWASLVAQLVKTTPVVWKTWVQSLGWKDPLEKEKAIHSSILGFSCGSAGKESACNAGDLGSVPGLGRSPGEGKATRSSIFWPVHGVAKSWTRLSNFHFHFQASSATLSGHPAPGD